MTDQPERWDLVGEAITKRVAKMNLTMAELQRRSKISFQTLQGYMSGQPIVRVDKRRDLARALEWTSDSIARILEGGEPELLSNSGGTVLSSLIEDWRREFSLSLTQVVDKLLHAGIDGEDDDVVGWISGSSTPKYRSTVEAIQERMGHYGRSRDLPGLLGFPTATEYNQFDPGHVADHDDDHVRDVVERLAARLRAVEQELADMKARPSEFAVAAEADGALPVTAGGEPTVSRPVGVDPEPEGP